MSAPQTQSDYFNLLPLDEKQRKELIDRLIKERDDKIAAETSSPGTSATKPVNETQGTVRPSLLSER
jgi:hypothetical protein